MARADYEINLVAYLEDQTLVFLSDLDLGNSSVTNDAEAVVAEVLALHPRCRIAYRDSERQLAELLHDGQAFTGFGPWPPLS